MTHTGRLAKINRYPIKSIGGEALDTVSLGRTQALPGDRRFAVIHEDGLRHLEGGALTRWLPKSAFVRGVAAAPLQAIRGGWDGDNLVLTHPERPELRFDPTQGDAALVAWLEPLWSPSGKAPAARLVEGPQPLTDVNQPWVSILSRSSLAALEDKLGQTLGTDRWRGNLWIDGWPAWAERDLVNGTIQIGEVEFVILAAIGRCEATSADTTTGRLDCDMPAELRALNGDHDFGVYAQVLNPGTIRLGDAAVAL